MKEIESEANIFVVTMSKSDEDYNDENSSYSESDCENEEDEAVERDLMVPNLEKEKQKTTAYRVGFKSASKRQLEVCFQII